MTDWQIAFWSAVGGAVVGGLLATAGTVGVERWLDKRRQAARLRLLKAHLEALDGQCEQVAQIKSIGLAKAAAHLSDAPYFIERQWAEIGPDSALLAGLVGVTRALYEVGRQGEFSLAQLSGGAGRVDVQEQALSESLSNLREAIRAALEALPS